jgi:hypothetical protein
MDPRERKDILGQWGSGLVDGPRDRKARAVLESDLDGSPVKGKPLRQRLRNWRADAETYLASMGGPLPYMQRLKLIEEAEADHLRRLESVWRALARRIADPAAFAERWRRLAERRNFYAVNELIELHNRWYPLESRLPMDPRTGDFVQVNGRSYRRRLLDAAWVLERFPADREVALAAGPPPAAEPPAAS